MIPLSLYLVAEMTNPDSMGRTECAQGSGHQHVPFPLVQGLGQGWGIGQESDTGSRDDSAVFKQRYLMLGNRHS